MGGTASTLMSQEVPLETVARKRPVEARQAAVTLRLMALEQAPWPHVQEGLHSSAKQRDSYV